MDKNEFIKMQQAVYEKCIRDILDNFHVIACALIKRYFEIQPQLLKHGGTRFLYDEACGVLAKEEACRIDVSDVTVGECAPCVAFCMDLLQKYQERNIH